MGSLETEGSYSQHYSAYSLDYSASWSAPYLALQSGMGLWPQRYSGGDPGSDTHPVPALTLAQAKPGAAEAWVKKGIEFYKANGKDNALAAFNDPKELVGRESVAHPAFSIISFPQHSSSGTMKKTCRPEQRRECIAA